jgi:hypothetical protein
MIIIGGSKVRFSSEFANGDHRANGDQGLWVLSAEC